LTEYNENYEPIIIISNWIDGLVRNKAISSIYYKFKDIDKKFIDIFFCCCPIGLTGKIIIISFLIMCKVKAILNQKVELEKPQQN
jgi:hypothetical protein